MNREQHIARINAEVLAAREAVRSVKVSVVTPRNKYGDYQALYNLLVLTSPFTIPFLLTLLILKW